MFGVVVVFERLFVFTLGFHEDFAIRRLTSSAAGRSDAVLCATIRPVASATFRAYNNLVSFASVSGVRVLRLLDVDPGDPASAVASIMSEVLNVGGVKNVIFDVSGGSRGVTTPAVLAALLLPSLGYNVDIYVSSDGGDVWEARIPSSFLRLLTLNVSQQKLEMLRVLRENQGLTAEEIAAKLRLHEKTVKNKLAELSREDLIARRGRGGGVYLTQWGNLVAFIASAMAERAAGVEVVEAELEEGLMEA
jgi:CRISPR-associated protein Csa3